MEGQTATIDIKSINEKIEKESAFVDLLVMEMSKVIVGQKYMIERLLIGLLGQGHILLEGVPGLAKTLAINTLSKAVKGSFSRIQFTPDLLPADVVGTMIYNIKENEFTIKKGPVFANFVLADEINRAPAKVQSALLEAMQEKQVSIGGKVYILEKPFFVIATQNPIDQEGTYPLPEAQQDRFLFNIFVDYPEYTDEMDIVRNVTGGISEEIECAVTGAEILEYQELIKRAPVAEHVLDYAVNLVRATRREKEEAPDFIKDWINIGAGPRACLSLISAAKTRAILHGNYHVSIEDVNAVAKPVLRHRIAPNFSAQAEGITSDIIVEKLLEYAMGD